VDGLIDRKRLSLELALALISRVREEAVSRELELAIAVVDDAGNVVASQRMDGTALGAMRLAFGKAYTSVQWGMPSGEFMQTTQPGGADWGWNVTDPRIVVYAGGLPLFVEGALVGGIGASGGTAADDAECVVTATRSLGFS
jgi:uncharacterized protein GlcG (DUF336 family)